MRVSSDETYISKKDLVRTDEKPFNRFVRRYGTWYRRSALEVIYEETDWLAYCDDDVYNVLNRFTVAKRYFGDFKKSGLGEVGVPNMAKIKVDGGFKGFGKSSAYMESAESRYIQASRAVAAWILPILQRVCLEDKLIDKAQAHHLCAGLDYLIFYYFTKKSS